MNPTRRRRGLLAESEGLPLFDDPFGSDLQILYEETILEARKASTGKIGKTERAAHMGQLQDVYKNQIAQMAKDGHPATAEDVYAAITSAWGQAVGKGISQDEYAKFMRVLDGIRDEWASNPDGPHRLGPHVYRTEKENLASYVAQWITAGMIGSASVGSRAPGFGSHGWINAPDRGGSADSGRAGGGGGGGGSVSSDYRRPRIAGHGVVGPDESRTRRRHYDTLDDVAQMIPDDVNDTWELERTIIEAGPAVPAGAAGPAGGGAAGPAGGGAAGGGDPKQSAADFAEADKAAGIVKAKLDSLVKTNTLTPDMKQKFAQFADYLAGVAKGQGGGAPAGSGVAG